MRPEVERLMEELPEFDADDVSSKVYAMLQGEKGNMTKALQGELMQFQGPMNELAEGIMENARMMQSPTDMALMKLLNVEVSPKFKKQFPQLDMLIKSGQVTIAQLAEIAKQTGVLSKEGGGAIETTGSGSFGVR